jgi:hypothetical protein
MAMATRVAGEQQQRGQWRQGQLWWAKMRVVVMVMRLAGNKEGEGSLVMAMVKRMTGEQWQRQRRRQGQMQ